MWRSGTVKWLLIGPEWWRIYVGCFVFFFLKINFLLAWQRSHLPWESPGRCKRSTPLSGSCPWCSWSGPSLSRLRRTPLPAANIEGHFFTYLQTGSHGDPFNTRCDLPWCDLLEQPREPLNSPGAVFTYIGYHNIIIFKRSHIILIVFFTLDTSEEASLHEVLQIKTQHIYPSIYSLPQKSFLLKLMLSWKVTKKKRRPSRGAHFLNGRESSFTGQTHIIVRKHWYKVNFAECGAFKRVSYQSGLFISKEMGEKRGKFLPFTRHDAAHKKNKNKLETHYHITVIASVTQRAMQHWQYALMATLHSTETAEKRLSAVTNESSSSVGLKTTSPS